MGPYGFIAKWITENWREAGILTALGVQLVWALVALKKAQQSPPTALNLASGPHQGALDLSVYAKSADVTRLELAVTGVEEEARNATRIASDARFAQDKLETDVRDLVKNFREHRDEFVEERAERRGDSRRILDAIEARK